MAQDMAQPPENTTPIDVNSANIPGQPDFAGRPNEHLSPEQRAGEIAFYLQEARQECRSDIDRVEDEQAKRLFGQIVEILDGAIGALYGFQGGDRNAQVRRS